MELRSKVVTMNLLVKSDPFYAIYSRSYDALLHDARHSGVPAYRCAKQYLFLGLDLLRLSKTSLVPLYWPP